MKDKKTGNSIFKFEREAGIDSPLGNWRKKKEKTLSIQFVSCSYDETNYYIKLIINSISLVDNNAKIFIYEHNEVFSNSLIASARINLNKTSKTNVTIEVVKSKIADLNDNFEFGGFEFIATVTCNGLSSETKEFKLNCLEEKKKDDVEKKPEKDKCLCNKTKLTADDLKLIVTQLRKKEKTGVSRALRDKTNTKNYKLGEYILDKEGKRQYIERTQFDEINDSIFTLNVTEKITSTDANFKEFSKYLNKAFKKYEINNCLRKIHFLAQSYHETQRFLKTNEGKPNSNVSGGKKFRGRGFLQLTHDYNYRDFYKDYYGKEITDDKLKEFAPKVATSIEIACLASAWYWKDKNLNKYADLDSVTKISAAINYPKALSDKEKDIAHINGLEERKKFTNILKTIFKYEECNK